MSKIVNETRLDYYTHLLWERIKTQLTNETFKNAELIQGTTTLRFTRKDNQVVDVDLAKFMNRYYSVADMVTGEANRGTYQNGDIIHTQDNDKKYLCINMGAANFQDAIIELTPQQGINLPIDATDVRYDNNQTNLVALNVQAAIDEIHGILSNSYNDSAYNPVNGELTLTKVNGQQVTYNLAVINPNTIVNAQLTPGTNIVQFTQVDGNTKDVDLTPLLVANKVTFNKGNTGMQSDNVQDAIEELNTELGNSYVGSDYNAQTGKLALIKKDGNRDEYDLATGTVKSVNGQPADPNGNVVLNSTHIPYDNQNSQLVANNAQAAIDAVNTKFNGGYNASAYDRVTGELTLTKFDGTSNKLNIVDPSTFVDAQLNVGTNTVQFTKVDGGTKDVDLTPLLIANKITFNPGNTGMVAQDVQAAIEELKKDMGLLDNSDIYIVPDDAGLNNLLAQNTMKKGDIIYIINSDGVVDFDNTSVNNGTNPVAMIYDTDIIIPGSNQLRVFSKLETPINLIASNVAFDSNNVDGVNAQNVQEAIKQVNTTARDSYNDSTYNAITGELKLIKHDGSEKTHQLATRNPESIINAQLNGNIITFTRENQQTFDLNLKDLNLDKLIERVELVDTKLQLTKVDGTRFEVDLDPLLVADKIKYNNAVSGLAATDVQGAIDELNGKFIEDVTYDETQNRTIFKTKGGQQEAVVEGLVTRWKHLEHAEEYQHVNLMEYNKKVTGYYYGNANPDNWTQHSDWSTYFLDVKPNESYTVIRRTNDSVRYVFTSSVGSVKINAGNYGGTLNNGFYFSKITIPNDNRITKLAIQFQHGVNAINDIMVLRGHYDSIDGFIPYADEKTIQIGTDISYAFDNEGTSLKSTTVSSAIKELDNNVLPTTDYPIVNKFNPKEMVLGKRYDTNGDIIGDARYATYTYPCTSGQTFTIAKRIEDNIRYVYLNQDDVVVDTGNMPKNTREWIHYKMTVPTNPAIVKIGFNINLTVNATKVMIFDGHNELPAGTQYVPYLAERLIDGDKVLHSFNNVGTNLSSTTTKEAIEELALSKVDKYTTTFNRFKSYKDYSAKYYRIPSLLATNKGTLLSFADIRYNTAKDQSLIDIGVARSVDDGTLWNNAIAMKSTKVHPTESRVMDSTSVYVPNANKIILLAGGWDSGAANWTSATTTPDPLWNPFIVTSTDDGLTWSNRESLKNRVANVPQDTIAWLGGVGTGIVKKKGNNIGRVILPIQICVRDTNANRNVVKAGCIYSDDDGATWTMSTRFSEDGTSENMIAEIGNGDLIMIARRDAYASKAAYFSTDGGATWELHRTLSGAFTHGNVSCQGSWITIESNGQTIGLLSHPKNASNSYQRDNITIYMYNFDNPSQGVTELYNVYPYLGNAKGAGYSSLCYYKNIHGVDKLAIAFETNGNIEFRDITDALHSKNIKQTNNRISELYDRKVDKYTPSNANDLTVESLKLAGSPIKQAHTVVGSGLAGTRTLAGNKNAYAQADTKISKIQVGLHGYLEGEKVTGIEVYAVKRDDDTIVERIIYEGIGVAKYPLNTTVNDVLFVDVEINKSFTEDVYFIARLKHNGTKGMYLCGADNANGIAFDKTTDNEELTQGTPIVATSARFASMLVYGGVSLSDAIVNVELNNTNGIDFTKANGTITTVNIPNTGGGTVTSVNGINPQGGNVTVNAEHIGYTDTNNLGVDKVQGAIDNLANKTANIVNDIAYNNVDKTLTVTKNGVQQQPPIDLSSLVGIETINSQPGVDGNVDLSLKIVADNLEFKAENTLIDTLELYTDADANDLIQYFI